MSVVNPKSPRFPWLLFALVLVAVSVARIVLVANTGFNGLIGQDAYAYFSYVLDSLVVDGALVFPPPPFGLVTAHRDSTENIKSVPGPQSTAQGALAWQTRACAASGMRASTAVSHP